MKRFALIAAAVLALTGCAQEPPPVSEKVQQYYDTAQTRQAKAMSTPAARTKPLVVFLGDSFTAGNDETPGARKYGYMDQAADKLGWDKANLAQGGTGYVNPGENESTNFAGQAWRAVNLKPDVLIIGGGINDRKYPSEQVATAASGLFKDLKRKLPKTKLVVVGPVTPGLDEGRNRDAIPVRDAIEVAATDNGVPFIDPIDENWMPTIDGVTGPTDFHPNAAGHKLLASKLMPHLKKVVPEG